MTPAMELVLLCWAVLIAAASLVALGFIHLAPPDDEDRRPRAVGRNRS